MRLLLFIAGLWLAGCSTGGRPESLSRYKAQAKRVTIIRDEWGIPHVYGKSDADAVFGVMYAQCEENFERVEQAYIQQLGRLAEIEGRASLYQDLKMRLMHDTAEAKQAYLQCTPQLRALLQAFSDGIHYYLYRNPGVKPRLLTSFEPWYPLLFSDGAFLSMQDGGLQTADMRALFGEQLGAPVAVEGSTPQMPTGSNGFAIAPQRSADGTALLYINPHVSFYFRTEMHMVSEEGLNAYGAVTWGQFFVFQGFNERCGWMHTSSAVDVADLYAEKMERKEDRLYYHYDGTLRPFSEKELTLRYDEGGDKKSCTVKAYASHHGPVVGTRGGKWLTWKGKPFRVESLEQSWQRMKARGWDDFVRVLSLQANASTNTLYADADGNIAYWHGNFVPKRAGAVDPAGLLDGSVSSTDWQGLHSLQDLVHYRNPPGGFLQNCNSSPLTAAGQKLAQTYASYLAPEKDNFRSLHAIGELSKKVAFTPESLAALGYDTYLAAFDTLLPPLLSDLGALQRGDSSYQLFSEAADTLRNWSRRSAVHSVATTVAIFWAYDLLSQHGSYIGGESDAVKGMGELIRRCTYAERKAALWRTLSALDNLFGTWKVEWGRINRFQRTPGKLEQNFEESEDDFPVGLGPAFLGCLPSYETVFKNNRLYGVGGNSFVAVVSFGPRVKAKSISTGGQSFNPYSPHFLDQTSRFLTGQLKDVPFYREDVLKGARRSYHPGE